ncbi:GNAT family N-acetyltransferase [Streptomyces sp. NPDC048277]|uniref:GNAT family N-acetyltransferase n=1 Tax=Streptomyces sp. NPDC048277 TaxID=3155027 RepID=UPI0033D1E11F
MGRASLDEPEIAYELFRRAHGQGYAAEAASAVLDAAITTGRTRLWATVRSWNAPSFRASWISHQPKSVVCWQLNPAAMLHAATTR